MKTNHRSSIRQAGSKERTKNIKRIFLAAVALMLLAAWPANAQEGAFVWDGDRLQPVTNTRDLACRKWSIWLFTSDDHDKIPGTQWGNIVGESESDVMDQLKIGQDSDDLVVRGSRNPQGDAWLSHRNYTGPICNVKPPDADINDALDQLESLGHRLDQAYSVIRRLLPGHASELQDHLKQLAQTLQRVDKLRNDLVQRQRSAMMTVNSSVDEITRKTDALQGNSQQFARRFGSGPRVNNPPSPSSGYPVDVNGQQIIQKISNTGDQVTISQTVAGSSMGQTYAIPKVDLGIGTTSIRQQGLAWIVTVVLPRRSARLHISTASGQDEVVSRFELFFSTEGEARTAVRSLTNGIGH